MTLHPDVQAFHQSLRELEAYLADRDQKFWAAKIGRVADRIAASDVHGLREFYSLFGGMGSLNDLILQPDAPDASDMNDEFHRLLDNAGRHAAKLKDELR